MPDFAHDEFELKHSNRGEYIQRNYPQKNGYPIVPWEEVQGNKFLTALHSLMLTPEGYYLFKKTRVTGQRQHESPILCFVHYNREFVVQKLANQLLDLKPAGFNEIQRVIGEAWKACKHIDENPF